MLRNGGQVYRIHVRTEWQSGNNIGQETGAGALTDADV